MKNIILILVLTCSLNPIFSQYFVDDVSLENLDATYIQIFISPNLTGRGCTVNVDYGPNRIVGIMRKLRLRHSPNGRPVFFESSLEVLNFMHSNGYGLKQALTDSNGSAISYILEQRI